MYFKLGLIIIAITVINPSLGGPQCTCPRNLAPVCGSDGKNYENRCLLECAKALRSDLTVAKEGSCENTDKDCDCPDSDTPVCGTDRVNYSNVCRLRCARVKNPELEVHSQGACERVKRKSPYDLRYSMHRSAPCSF